MRSLPAMIALLSTIALSLGACGGGEVAAGPASSGDYPKTVDSCGSPVTLDRPPERIVTGGTYAVQLIAAAGGADRIVGRYFEFGSTLLGPGKAAADAPILAPDDTVSIESILATNADLNLSSPGVTTVAKAEALKTAGIPTLYPAGECVYLERPDPQQAKVTFDDIYASIEQLGGLFGTKSTAQAAVAALRDRVAAVQSKTAASGKTAMQVQIFDNVIYNVSGKPAIEQTQLDTLGLKNPAAGTGDEINAEALIGLDPDVIILQYGFDEGDGIKTLEKAKQEFLAVPGVSTMTAVTNDAIIGVNVFLTYPDPLAVDGIEELARQLDEKR